MDKFIQKFEPVKTLVYTNNTYTTTQSGVKFVFELILDTVNDLSFQKDVLEKLKLYTSYTKEYLSQVHHMPEKFDTILKNLRSYIFRFIEKNSVNVDEKSVTQNEHTGFILNLDLETSPSEWDPVVTWIDKLFESSEFEPIPDYECKEMIMFSIAGPGTVEKYGKDGFMALFIVFINDYDLEEICKIETLVMLTERTVANKFNRLVNDNNSLSIKISMNSYEQSGINPKIQIEKWIRLLDSIVTILPGEQFERCVPYIKSSIQKVLFKKKITARLSRIDTTIFSTNIVENIAKCDLNEDLQQCIIKMYQISSIEEWLKFLRQLIILDNHFITLLFFTISPDFAGIFLDINIKSLCMSDMTKYSVAKYFRFYSCLTIRAIRINDVLYEISQSSPIGSGKRTSKKWIYDKNLDLMGYEITTPGFNSNREVIVYDLNDNVLSKTQL